MEESEGFKPAWGTAEACPPVGDQKEFGVPPMALTRPSKDGPGSSPGEKIGSCTYSNSALLTDSLLIPRLIPLTDFSSTDRPFARRT